VPPGQLHPGLFFGGGAASTSLPRLVSTSFGDRRIPFVSASRSGARSAPVRGLRCRGRGFYHRRVLSQPLPADSFFLSGTALAAAARQPVHRVGRGFYHRRVLSQPIWRLSYFICQPRRPVQISQSRGRGFYHRRVQGQQPSSALFFLRRALGCETRVTASGPLPNAMGCPRQFLLIGSTGPTVAPKDLGTAFMGVNPRAKGGFSPGIFSVWTPGEQPARRAHASRPALGRGTPG
jgi:hypothetical protein